jgi:hypothetical protein
MKNISNLWRRFFRKEALATPAATLSTLSVLIDAPDAMLNCAQVFDLIDQYAERAAHGEDVTQLMPLVAAHLEACPDCREHYEALERILKAS